MSDQQQSDDSEVSSETDDAEELQTSDTEDTTLLREQMEEALREKDQFRTLAQRSQADLVNYRRRASEEVAETRKNAKSQIIFKLLSVADDFNRAMEMVPEDSVESSWLEGMKIVHRSLENILDTESVSKIESEGMPFDPSEHEAVFYEVAEGIEEGTVVRVIRDGYKLNDKILRAAQVTVAKAPEIEPETELESTEQEAS